MPPRRLHRLTLLLAAGLVLGVSPTAPGQEPETLVPIEEGVGDVDPLATSLRNLRLDLRAPSDFDHVYHVPGRDDLLMRVDGGLYAVFSLSEYRPSAGGLITLIPANTIYFIGPPYETDGLETLVPPPIPVTSYSELPLDATIHAPRIERPPTDLRTDLLTTTRLELRVGTDDDDEDAPDPGAALTARLASRDPRAGLLAPAATTDHGPAILTDAAYRSSRLLALMRRAAAAAQTEGYAARGPQSSSSK